MLNTGTPEMRSSADTRPMRQARAKPATATHTSTHAPPTKSLQWSVMTDQSNWYWTSRKITGQASDRLGGRGMSPRPPESGWPRSDLDELRLTTGPDTVRDEVVLLESRAEPLGPARDHALVRRVVAQPVVDPRLQLVVAERHEVRVGVHPQRRPVEEHQVRVRLLRAVHVELGQH